MSSNKLQSESSPYLLQHAHNPVNWFPWGKEAFDEAEKQNKPIIISIGYSACHWCHVMEKECFEDEDIAGYMNQHFVCIKVDREERPDVDMVYMQAVQFIQGNGGWPLNVFALPDRRPFWGGTYFPPAGWIQVLEQIVSLYEDEKDKLEEQAGNIEQEINKPGILSMKAGSNKEVTADFHAIINNFTRYFDMANGGLGRAPKFPTPVNFEFLLDYFLLNKEDHELQEFIEVSLIKMAKGGIYDQLGGGFARYSVDEIWKVPHFEKMLYDNAQLISLYAKAFGVFDKEIYRRIVVESLDYTEQEMTSPERMFYSALDADSEGEEGKYYTWTVDEIRNILGEDAAIFIEFYQAGGEGLWEFDKNILMRVENEEEYAAAYDLEEKELTDKIEALKSLLLQERNKRTKPALDDKSLTSWNCMMIKAYLDAWIFLKDKKYLETACRSAGALEEKIKSKDGGLFHLWKKGIAKTKGFLEDYAHYADLMFYLYESTFDKHWLDESLWAVDYAIEHLYDKETGLFFINKDDEYLIARKHDTYDSVIPSSNSTMFRVMYRLGLLHDKVDYLDMVKKACSIMNENTLKYPTSHANWARLLLEVQEPFYVVAVCGEEAKEKAGVILRNTYPGKLLTGSVLESNQPYLANRFVKGKTIVYVCKDKVCKLPVEDTAEAIKLLSK